MRHRKLVPGGFGAGLKRLANPRIHMHLVSLVASTGEWDGGGEEFMTESVFDKLTDTRQCGSCPKRLLPKEAPAQRGSCPKR